MRLEFDEEHPFQRQRGRLYPALRVTLYHGSRSTSTFALLDTGADTCLFHETFARRIGLRLMEGDPDYIGGIKPGSRIRVYFHRVRMRIGYGSELTFKVAFSNEIKEEMTDQLIGREVVFDARRFALRQGAGDGKLYVGGRP